MGEVDADVVIAEVGDQRAVAGGPGGAGERRAALGGHRGAHHGEQRQAPSGSGGHQQRTSCLAPGPARGTGEDAQGHGQHQQGVAEVDRHRPGAVAVEHGEPAQGTLDQQQDDEGGTGDGEIGALPAAQEGQDRKEQDERADQHARDQAMHPLQHDLGIGVADVRARPRDRTAVVPSGRSRWASRGRTGPNWWSGPRHPGRSGHRPGSR